MSIAKRQAKRRKNLYMVFIDFKNAFDMVGHGKMMDKLLSIGLNRATIDFVSAMYAKTQYALKIDNGKRTEYFKQKRGLRQGCPLSSLLFNLFIDQIVTIVNENSENSIKIGGLPINCLLYADDIVILAENPNKLQECLDRVSEFIGERGLTISPSKTKCMTLRPSEYELALCQNKLEYVSSYKYLGVTLDNGLTLKEHFTNCRSRVEYVLSILRRLSYKSRICVKDMLLIFDSLARTCILYASEAWSNFVSKSLKQWDVGPIERLHFRAIKSILSVKRNVENNASRTELNRLPLLFNVERFIIKYLFSVISRPDSIVHKLLNDPNYAGLGLSNRGADSLGLEIQNLQQQNIGIKLLDHKQEFEGRFRNHWDIIKNKSKKLKETYYAHKDLFCYDKYLEIKESGVRATLTRFRLSHTVNQYVPLCSGKCLHSMFRKHSNKIIISKVEYFSAI